VFIFKYAQVFIYYIHFVVAPGNVILYMIVLYSYARSD
jgi:hypothetical protein